LAQTYHWKSRSSSEKRPGDLHSIPRVDKTYTELEAMGLIELPPKSGYYVSGEGSMQLNPPAFKKRAPILFATRH
jgi:hypothetical protein